MKNKISNLFRWAVFSGIQLRLVIAMCVCTLYTCTPANENSAVSEQPFVPEKTAVAPLPPPVPAKSIIAIYKNTPLRKTKIMQGASAYIDSTYKHDLLVVKDCIIYIGAEDGGRPYVILGKNSADSTYRAETLKCSFRFRDINVLDSFRIGQVITLASSRNEACYKASTTNDSITTRLIVEMEHCKLIK